MLNSGMIAFIERMDNDVRMMKLSENFATIAVRNVPGIRIAVRCCVEIQ